jgi:hypothetical protein
LTLGGESNRKAFDYFFVINRQPRSRPTIFVILWFTFDLPWTTLVSLKEGCARLCWRLENGRIEEKGTHDVGVEDDLLHHMRMVGYEKIYAMLEIIIEICGETKV